MKQIKSGDTKPEMLVRRFLHAQGFRYLLHNKALPGTPDLTLKKYKTVVFVNGCFWHGHINCKYFKLPKTRTIWWQSKIEATRERDKKAKHALENMEWNVLFVWECELKKYKRSQTLKNLAKAIILNTSNKCKK